MSRIEPGDRVKLKVAEHDSSLWNERCGTVRSIEGNLVSVVVDGEKPDSKDMGYSFLLHEVEAIAS